MPKYESTAFKSVYSPSSVNLYAVIDGGLLWS